jgi:hypothetical protein
MRLFQVTNTPDVNETLSDVAAGCNGVSRIVYAMAGGFGDFDIWGFTFQLNDSVVDNLNDLIALIEGLNLHCSSCSIKILESHPRQWVDFFRSFLPASDSSQ